MTMQGMSGQKQDLGGKGVAHSEGGMAGMLEMKKAKMEPVQWQETALHPA